MVGNFGETFLMVRGRGSKGAQRSPQTTWFRCMYSNYSKIIQNRSLLQERSAESFHIFSRIQVSPPLQRITCLKPSGNPNTNRF